MRRDNPPTSAAARAISEWRRKRIKQQQEREAAVQRAITRIEQQPELADTESYNAAMLGCRLLERPEEALVLWDQMRAAGVRPSPESYQHALVSAMRLRRHDVLQLCVEEGQAVVYHVGGNSCRYEEAEEGRAVFPIGAAAAVEKLCSVYPAWLAVEDLPIDDEECEDEDEDEDEEGEEPFQPLPFVRQLLLAGVLEARR